ncbi:MAG: LytTR family DNA-binding domain-containing protein [Hyphomicrobiales bacterium]
MLDYIKPTRETAPALTSMVLHPLNYAVFSFASLFFFIFFAENRFGGPSLVGQIVYTILWSVLYFSILVFFIHRLSNFFVRRNVPLLFVVVLSFLTASIFEATIGHYFITPDQSDAPRFFWHIFAMMSVSIPGIVVNLLYHEKNARKALSDEADKVPYWMPVKRAVVEQAEEPLMLELPEAVRGPVLSIHAASQYVQVTTTNGTSELRMSLSKAIEGLPNTQGLRVHRSHWLQEQQIKSLVYKDGNPRVIDSFGETYPVSRKQVSSIKNLLNLTG